MSTLTHSRRRRKANRAHVRDDHLPRVFVFRGDSSDPRTFSAATRLPDPVREQIIQAVEPLLVYTPLRDVVGSNDEVVGGERNAVLFKLFEILREYSSQLSLERGLGLTLWGFVRITLLILSNRVTLLASGASRQERMARQNTRRNAT